MSPEFDPEKRARTLRTRGLDFAEADRLWNAGQITLTVETYPGTDAVRYHTMGKIADGVIVVIWTPRGDERRVISMRKANAKERRIFAAHVKAHP